MCSKGERFGWRVVESLSVFSLFRTTTPLLTAPHLQSCTLRWEGGRGGVRRSLSLALPAPPHLSSPHLEERGYCVHWADGREWEGCAEGMGGQWEGNGRGVYLCRFSVFSSSWISTSLTSVLSRSPILKDNLRGKTITRKVQILWWNLQRPKSFDTNKPNYTKLILTYAKYK